MSFTPYATAIAGSVLTASFWNQQVRDNGLVLKTSIADDGSLIDDNFDAVAISAGEIELDLEVARHFIFTLNAALPTTTIDNVPGGDVAAWFVLKVIGDGTPRAWDWFENDVKWASGIAPTPTSTVGHWDMYLFVSYDGGTTWTGSVIDQNYS